MTTKKAKAYILDYLADEIEARSIWQEITEDGVFNASHVEQFDSETLINVAEDLQYQVRCEIGYLLS